MCSVVSKKGEGTGKGGNLRQPQYMLGHPRVSLVRQRRCAVASGGHRRFWCSPWRAL